jgi:hypothetical protein
LNDKKKTPGLDGITGGIYRRTFNIFPALVSAIYNQCLERGCLPKRWKLAKIIPTTKPGQENSMDPSKCHPNCPLNIGGKILEKILINRINHHMYKQELLPDRQFGFTPQKSDTDAALVFGMCFTTLLKLELTSHSKAIAFADDLIILNRGESVGEAENYMNLEMKEVLEWAQNNKLEFNENKLKVMLMSGRRRRGEMR